MSDRDFFMKRVVDWIPLWCSRFIRVEGLTDDQKMQMLQIKKEILTHRDLLLQISEDMRREQEVADQESKFRSIFKNEDYFILALELLLLLDVIDEKGNTLIGIREVGLLIAVIQALYEHKAFKFDKKHNPEKVYPIFLEQFNIKCTGPLDRSSRRYKNNIERARSYAKASLLTYHTKPAKNLL